MDFDFAAPGERLADVAYLAWSWCVSSRPDRGPVAGQARQVRLVADVYGLPQPDLLLPALGRRLRDNEAFWQALPEHPRAAEFAGWTAREIAYVDSHRGTFAAALSR